MALTEEQKRKIEEEEQHRAQIETSTSNDTTVKYGVPAILSFFIPGLGQIVKGQVLKGILFFCGWLVGLFFFVIPGVVIWIWQIADAYNN